MFTSLQTVTPAVFNYPTLQPIHQYTSCKGMIRDLQERMKGNAEEMLSHIVSFIQQPIQIT